VSVADYHAPHITERLADTLASMSADGATLSVQELAGFDQFHTGGLSATVRLTALVSIDAESNVLDVGSGLGGPARYIASTYGARVTGIDLSPTFVEAAVMINDRTSLGARVSFRTGNALALPFPPDTFDVVIMQHVAMNIADRAALYAGIRNVLRNGGQFLTYDIIERTGPPAYPVPWSSTPQTSFLLTESATRQALEDARFAVETWQVQGPEAAAAFQLPPGVQAPPIAAILGRPNFGQAVANLAASIADGRVAVLTAVLRKSR
jgi:ubiquinone/menaquinone biosynthesis C-methylase UbiE